MPKKKREGKKCGQEIWVGTKAQAQSPSYETLQCNRAVKMFISAFFVGSFVRNNISQYHNITSKVDEVLALSLYLHTTYNINILKFKVFVDITTLILHAQLSLTRLTGLAVKTVDIEI